MAMEVRCGQCYGILLIETPGVVVACPHCGVHLSFPGTEAETKVDPALDRGIDSETETPYPFKLAEGFARQQPIAEPKSDLPTESTAPVVQPPVVQPPVVPQPVMTHVVVSHLIVPPPAASHAVVPPVVSPVVSPTAESISGPDFSWMSPSERSQTTIPPSSVPFTGLDSAAAKSASEVQGFASAPVSTGDVKPVAQPAATGFSFSTPEVPTTPIRTVPSEQLQLGTAGDLAAAPPFDTSTHQLPGDSNESTINDVVDPSLCVGSTASRSSTNKDRGSCLALLLLIVGTYASLVTIYALYLTFLGRTHQLESLPDLKTVPQQGGRAVVPRPENELPRGHELRIGQSQRYGNIRVTPLRVTRGPIKFAYFKDEPDNVRAPSEDVLKLWLKFENVSVEQPITPIDSTLMYFQRGNSPVIALNVIFRYLDRKKKDAQFFYNFDRLPAESEWRIVGQETNRELLPHEEYETFIPSQENIEGLNGEAVWRVHFRKGYGPQTGNGVTTLIDVRFKSDDIVPDPS